MAYRVRPVSKKDGTQGFKVMWETKVDGKSTYRFIKRKDWAPLGFSPGMSYAQAVALMHSLNAKARMDRHEEKRTKVLAQLQKEQDAQLAFLPAPLVAQFEETRLPEFAQEKTPAYWQAARRCICAVGLLPQDWEENKDRFYTEFKRRGYGTSYVQKILRVMNAWGAFWAKRTQQAFLPVPPPVGRWRQQLQDASRKKERRRGNRKSAPLRPDVLASKENAFPKKEHFRWLHATVWLGLRPEEADGLNKPEGRDSDSWYLEDAGGVTVIWIYQGKLQSTVDYEERWKPIPCFHEEQQRLIDWLRQGLKFQRPIKKVLESRLGPGVTGYAGRKGFTKLMKSLGQAVEDVSIWMGHKSIDRTYKDYVEKQSVSFTKVA